MDQHDGQRERNGGVEEEALRNALALEREVQDALDAAEAQAGRIVAEAQQQAHARRVQADEQAHAWADNALHCAAGEIEQETANLQSQADAQAHAWLETAAQRRTQALARILGAVLLAPEG